MNGGIQVYIHDRKINNYENTCVSKVKSFSNKILRYRYFIAAIVFLLLVFFKVNGSSVDFWSNYIDNSGKTSVVEGTAKGIRSDEWAVLLPVYLSQINSSTPFSIINPLITTSGQNVLITMGAPVKDIYTISKPLHWGFMLFGADRGLAWYWNMKLILIILLSYELCMIITKGNKQVSSLGSIWIAFSPAVQWWFVQHVGDNVLYFEAIVVTFYYFLKYFNKLGLKILFAGLFALSCVGYVTPFYPPVQVPFGFLCIIMMILIFGDFREKIQIKKSDILIAGCTITFIILMLVHLYLIIKDALPLMNHTVYPGKRISTGGDGPVYGSFDYLLNIILPFKGVSLDNPCELSSFYNFLPAVLLVMPVFIKHKVSSLKYGIAFSIYSVFFALYAHYSFIPAFISKITLLSYVTGVRAFLAYAFAAMLLSIWALAELWRSGDVNRIYGIIVAAAVTVVYFSAVKIIGISGNEFKYSVAAIIIFVILNYLFVRGYKRIFSASMIIIILVSGATVNPINIGSGLLLKCNIASEIQFIKKSEPDAVWMGLDADENDGLAILDVLIYANGAKTIGGINNYPDYAKWSLIDPSGKYSYIYNRSAHITFQIVNNNTNFTAIGKNAFRVNINVNDIKKFNVKYILSNKNLEQYNNENVTFKARFARDNRNYTVYEVSYS